MRLKCPFMWHSTGDASRFSLSPPAFRGIGSSKVTVLGYGLLTTDARPLVEALARQRFAVVVVDESHYLKSRNAARTKILVPLVQSAKRAVLLTGTPALGRPEEVNGNPAGGDATPSGGSGCARTLRPRERAQATALASHRGGAGRSPW